jgi:hypothetical protein
MAVIEVPDRPCSRNSALAASSRFERMRWPALRVARALWRGAASGVAVAASRLSLVTRGTPGDMVIALFV